MAPAHGWQINAGCFPEVSALAHVGLSVGVLRASDPREGRAEATGTLTTSPWSHTVLSTTSLWLHRFSVGGDCTGCESQEARITGPPWRLFTTGATKRVRSGMTLGFWPKWLGEWWCRLLRGRSACLGEGSWESRTLFWTPVWETSPLHWKLLSIGAAVLCWFWASISLRLGGELSQGLVLICPLN